MPRNAQGLYTLPAGNPVISGTEIESVWANTTMDDVASAMTASLPRDGSAPMTGPLFLANSTPQGAKEATSKAYVDQFMSFASGMPVGGVMAYAGTVIPPGFFECNGQALNRVTYATLFAAIGVTYGAGDASTTFNLPDMRDQFIRGVSPTRPIGNTQTSQFGTHNHGIGDPGHIHGLTDPGHVHTASQPAHGHTANVSDPGHAHPANSQVLENTDLRQGGPYDIWFHPGTTGAAATGITVGIAAAQPGVTVAAKVTGATVASAVTGIGTGVAGGDETRPQNIAQIYIIKAVQDSSGPAMLVGITTSDAQMISVDLTLPNTPELVIHSNVAFGTVKLDAGGQIPLGLLPSSSQQLLGYWDASAGQTPSQASPSTNFASGDTFIISVTGLLTVFNPVTLTASPTTVNVGSLLQFIENSLTNPTGWYYVVGSTTVVASQVGLSPVGTIAATNVQAGFAEVDGDLVLLAADIALLESDVLTLQGDVATKVDQSSATGAALIPAGTTAERDTAVLGAFRYNSQLNVFEGLNNIGWGQVGGGQMFGAAPVKGIFYNAQIIDEDVTVEANTNGGSFGPITVANGRTVTVSNGSTWSVV